MDAQTPRSIHSVDARDTADDARFTRQHEPAEGKTAPRLRADVAEHVDRVRGHADARVYVDDLADISEAWQAAALAWFKRAHAKLYACPS